MAITTRRWATEAETARYLGVNPATLWRWRKAEMAPPHYLIGGWTRYDLDEVDTWIAQRRQTAS